MSYYIYKNNSSLWERTAQTDTQYFSLPLDVAVGDVIDFMVGDYYYFGNTPLHVTITTPETDPLLLATLGRQPWCHFFGDPVNVVNGNYTYDQTDLSIPTPGKPLQFTRFYNSRDTYAGPLGKGWQHNYNTFLTPNQDNSIAVYYPDGHTFVFTPGGEGYTRPPGCFEALDKNPDGTFTLTCKDQTKYLYNAEGKLARILDKNNNAITLQYDNTLLTAVTEPAGRSLQFTYDQDNHLTQITDPAGRTIVFTYENGNLATVQDLNGGITTYTYTSAGLATITDPNGHTVAANTYDHQSRVIEQTDGKSNRTIFAYDPDNRKTTITDARGNTTTFYYDEKFRVTTIEHPDGTTNVYTYDDNHNQTSETDQNGHTTTYTYDPMGNQLTKTDPAPFNYVTTTTYDNQNNPTRIVDASGNAVDMTYDTDGNLQTVTRAVYGGVAITSFTYNDFGQVTSITNPNGKTTTITYDQYGNRESITDPLGNKTTYTYDILGRKLTETTPRGNVPGANPADFTWTYTYDENGNVLTVTDPLGHVTTNTYDLKCYCHPKKSRNRRC